MVWCTWSNAGTARSTSAISRSSEVSRSSQPQRRNSPGFASAPAPYAAVKWIPPKWDWVDPLKDRKAEIEAIDAGLKSRSDVIESEGYDAEEVDRRIAADHAREEELGLSFGQKAQGQEPAAGAEPEPEDRDPSQAPTTEENAA
jgi:capsid protein